MNDIATDAHILAAAQGDDGSRRFDETLFATRLWLDPWMEAFAPDGSGWWTTPEGGSEAGLPFLIERRSAGPVAVPVAVAPVNSHTPRFDWSDSSVPGAGLLSRMVRDLDVHALILPNVSPRSRLAAAVSAVRPVALTHRAMSEDAPFVACCGGFEAYLAGRGKSTRSNWLAKERRVMKQDGAFECLTRWEDLAPIYDELLAIESSGWKGREGTAIAQDRRAGCFYRSLCQSLSGHGHLRVFLLRQGTRIIAFQICTQFRGTLSSLKIGYLEECSRDSPGQVLQLQVLRWAFASDEIGVFDLLGPATPSKMDWATDVERLYTYFVFRPTALGALAAARWKMAPAAKATLLRLARRSQKRPLADPAVVPVGAEPAHESR